MIIKIKGSDGATYYRPLIKQSDGSTSYLPLPPGVKPLRKVKVNDKANG
jgi:hypothetical protein